MVWVMLCLASIYWNRSFFTEFHDFFIDRLINGWTDPRTLSCFLRKHPGRTDKPSCREQGQPCVLFYDCMIAWWYDMLEHLFYEKVIFFLFSWKRDRPMDGRTDRPTHGRMDGPTDPWTALWTDIPSLYLSFLLSFSLCFSRSLFSSLTRVNCLKNLCCYRRI